MIRRFLITTAYIALGLVLLTGCNYKPPYQRGYDEGYEAGLKASGGSGSSSDTGSDTSDASDASGSDSSAEDTAKGGKKKEKPGISGLKQKDNKTSDSEENTSSDSGEAADNASGGETSEGSAAGETTGEGDTVAATENTSSNAEVLGAESEPVENSADNGGSITIPKGRIIAAEAVNEALYSNPEVIDGLRQIYPDTAIFGEFVGDSETNIIHKVDGPHFSSLTYNTIVVFDGSKSLQDILNEGFFTKCDCAN